MPKREKVETGTDSRFVRRDSKGRFTSEQVGVGASLTADRRQRAKNTSKPGYGDKGDRKK